MDSLYSSAALTGSKLATVKPGISSISVPLSSSSRSKTSCKLLAGSVLTNTTLKPSFAN